MNRIGLGDWVMVSAIWAMIAVPGIYLVGSSGWPPILILPPLVLLATSVPLAALMARFRCISTQFAEQQEALEEKKAELLLSQELCATGLWRMDMRNGSHEWSDGMYRIAGLARLANQDKDFLSHVLPENGEQLEVSLNKHREDTDSYLIEFELCSPGNDEERKLIRARALNRFGHDGERVSAIMVTRDVTAEYQALEQVKKEHSLALEAVRKAQQLANTDPLTGLANRRHAMKELDQAIIVCQKSGEPLSLLTFDLDHFKQINDTHGHPAGDRILSRVAAIARTHARKGDTIGRIGGEEFVWLMPDADEGAAKQAGERLRWAIEAGSAVDSIPGVTASIGHACYREGDSSLKLFARADKALYMAKQSGRNRVRVAA